MAHVRIPGSIPPNRNSGTPSLIYSGTDLIPCTFNYGGLLSDIYMYISPIREQFCRVMFCDPINGELYYMHPDVYRLLAFILHNRSLYHNELSQFLDFSQSW